jgi:proteasome activator subunit 4
VVAKLLVPPHLPAHPLFVASNFGDRHRRLLWLQYFWFRHIFLLTAAQAARCQHTVVSLMRDRKLEVQEMAANTLSGMLKGLSEPAFDALRSDLLQQAQTLFPHRQRRRAGTVEFR